MNFASRTSLNLLYNIRNSYKLGNIRCIYAYYHAPSLHHVNLSASSSNIKILKFTRNPFLFKRYYADYPEHTIVTLPNLSPTMETGSIVSWAKKEGDAIAEGDLLAEIETDKATMSMDASEDGFIAKIFIEAGTKDIPIGTPLCVVVEEESSVGAFKDFKPTEGSAAPKKSEPKEKPAEPKQEPAPQVKQEAPPTQKVAGTSATGGRVIASPFAKKLAGEQGIDLSRLTGTGPGGRIIAVDVQQHKGAAAVGGLPSSRSMDASQMNMADRMVESKRNVPHYYLTVDVCIDRLMDVKKQLDGMASKKNEDNKLSLNDFIVKAAAKACLSVPEANSEWNGTSIRRYSSVDINITIPTQDGIVMPVVYSSESIGIKDINQQIKGFVQQASENKLSNEKLGMGTFTINNLSMHSGITSCAAIINPPQACVLTVGATQNKLVADSTAPHGFRQSTWMSVTLSCDHRIVDGAVGAQWLQQFRNNIEEPTLMLL